MEALSPISLPLDVLRTPNLNEGARRAKALQELEGIFLHLLMKEMRKSVSTSGLLGDSPAQKMFQEMLDEVYAQKMAESGQLGLAKVMAGQLELQEKHREALGALGEASSTAFLDTDRARWAQDAVSQPQMGISQRFIPVKPPAGGADNLSIDH